MPNLASHYYESFAKTAKILFDKLNKQEIQEDERQQHITRAICNRIYYALYHKAIHDNNYKLKSRGTHSDIYRRLNGKLQPEFQDFLDYREWADYNSNPQKMQLTRIMEDFRALLNKKLVFAKSRKRN